MLIQGDEKTPPSVGVYSLPEDDPQKTIFSMKVTNESENEVSFIPILTTRKRTLSGPTVHTKEAEKTTLKSKESTTLEFFRPALTKPESYLTSLTLHEPETKTQISNMLNFRWIISGQVDAEILYVKTDKNIYEKGETAQITVHYTGPADYKVKGGDGEISVEIKDSKGSSIGLGSVPVSLDKSGEATISITLAEAAVNPILTASISRQGETLDSYELSIESGASSSQKTESPKMVSAPPQKTSSFSSCFIFASIIVVIATFLFVRKYKKNSPEDPQIPQE